MSSLVSQSYFRLHLPNDGKGNVFSLFTPGGEGGTWSGPDGQVQIGGRGTLARDGFPLSRD